MNPSDGAGLPAQTAISALQRRLMVADSRPDEQWTILVENVPAWPNDSRPTVSGQSGGFGITPYSYAPSQGLPTLLEAVARRERKVSSSALIDLPHILVTSGGMNALGLIFRDAVAQGFRHAICQAPVFRGVHDLMTAAGMTVDLHTLQADSPDWAAVARRCRQGTLVYVNLPHNPTGATPAPSDVDRLVELAERGALVVYDAVYDSFRFAEDSCPAPIDQAIAHPGLLIVNSMSKNFGRPGDRIGWVVAHEQTIGRLLPRLEWETVCVNSQAQLNAAAVIDQGNDLLVGAVRAGREALRAKGIGVASGGTQLWLDVGVTGIEAFADFALESHHLVLTTSSNYLPSPDGYIRFPTGLAPELLRDGYDALRAAVAQWQERQP